MAHADTGTVPIADLQPGLQRVDDSTVEGIVTLTWPYSSSTKSTSLLLVEPDFRLRARRGQVRLFFHGAIAKTVSLAAVASGDKLLLKLRGAQWAKDDSAASTPGKGIEWRLEFREYLDVKIQRESGDVIPVFIDHPSSSSEASSEHTTAPHSPAPIHDALPPFQKTQIQPFGAGETWYSPAILKRAHLSATTYDPFSDDEEFPDNGRQKKLRFGRGSGQWRFADRTPSPVKELADVVMVDETPSKGAPKSPAAASPEQDVERQIAVEIPAEDQMVFVDVQGTDPNEHSTEATLEGDEKQIQVAPNEIVVEVGASQDFADESTLPRNSEASNGAGSKGPPGQKNVETVDNQSQLLDAGQPGRVSLPARDIFVDESTKSSPPLGQPVDDGSLQVKQYNSQASNLFVIDTNTTATGGDDSESVSGDTSVDEKAASIADLEANKTSINEDMRRETQVDSGLEGRIVHDSWREDAEHSDEVITYNEDPQKGAPSPSSSPGDINMTGAEVSMFEASLPPEDLLAHKPPSDPEIYYEQDHLNSEIHSQPDDLFNHIDSFGDESVNAASSEPATQQQATDYAAVEKDPSDIEIVDSMEPNENVQEPVNLDEPTRTSTQPEARDDANDHEQLVHTSHQEMRDANVGERIDRAMSMDQLDAEDSFGNLYSEPKKQDELKVEDEGPTHRASTEETSQQDTTVVSILKQPKCFDTEDDQAYRPRTTRELSQDPKESAVETFVEPPATIPDSVIPSMKSQLLTPSTTQKTSFRSEPSTVSLHTQLEDDTLPTPIATQPVTQDSMGEGSGHVPESLSIAEPPARQSSVNIEAPKQTSTDKLPSSPPISPITPMKPTKMKQWADKARAARRASQGTPRSNRSTSVASPWFAPRRSVQIVPDSDASNAPSEPDEQVKSVAHRIPRLIPATPERSLGKTFIRSSPYVEVETPKSTTSTQYEPDSQPILGGLRTKYSYYVPLKDLHEHVGTLTDVLVCALSSSAITRAAAGPRDFVQSIYLTDWSLPNTKKLVTTAQIFRPNKPCFPRIQQGDTIILREFKVNPFHHSFALISSETSSWAVFRPGEDVQMNGPIVEYGPEERGYVSGMRKWWGKLVSEYKERLMDQVPRHDTSPSVQSRKSEETTSSTGPPSRVNPEISKAALSNREPAISANIGPSNIVTMKEQPVKPTTTKTWAERDGKHHKQAKFAIPERWTSASFEPGSPTANDQAFNSMASEEHAAQTMQPQSPRGKGRGKTIKKEGINGMGVELPGSQRSQTAEMDDNVAKKKGKKTVDPYSTQGLAKEWIGDLSADEDSEDEKPTTRRRAMKTRNARAKASESTETEDVIVKTRPKRATRGGESTVDGTIKGMWWKKM
ncbi:uncharacterized protein KY384_005254 [Bacidia gigantensis]|uniref:uncharacterized protein n=1 Tax=Bacidia gigantensis TaxID=2732470 RepID=UPI001D0489F1|nr:uncharacterized protein KY384_005254 [Bacidia gigantensis]KAG8529773.1 hypothetical protein KY384_005254 [Bacidia gigantensis]